MRIKSTTLATLPALVAALLLAGAAPVAEAAKLTLGSGSGSGGGTVTLNLTFDKEGASVTAFDVSFLFAAPLAFGSAAAGPVATAAQKNVQTVAISGGVRLIVFGYNQTPIESGVVATLTFNIASGASSGTYNVTATSASASDPNGNIVALSAQGGAVTVGGGGGGQELLLSGGRVAVTCTWRNPYSGQSGNAIPIPQNDNFGFFYYEDRSNPEIFAKVLDFGADRPYLVFFGGLTDFQVSVTYRVLRTGQTLTLSKDPYNFNGGGNSTTLLH